MSASFTPGIEVPADDKVVLNVLLNCEETKSSKTKQVHFKSLPTTPLEIKKKIEEDFSIPSCVQTLHYQSMILKDSDQLQHTHFRSGDTFTVDYPIEAECEVVRNVIKWLKKLYEVLQSIEGNKSFPDEETDDRLMSDKILNLIMEGERTGNIRDLTETLFCPYRNKEKLMNRFYFHQESGLDVLMKIYGILVIKEWGDLGISKEFHIYLERKCSLATCNYVEAIPLCRQVIQLGGLEMCTTTLLRRPLWGDDGTLDTPTWNTLRFALHILCNLSELPECQMPLAKRTDIINQILAMGVHPAFDCRVAKMSIDVIVNLTQSPETHAYIVRREFVEKMLEICEQRYKMVNERSSQTRQGKKEDPMVVGILKCYTSIVLAQIGLGSPHLMLESIPPRLLQQILHLMSDVLEAASPAEIRLHDTVVWGTFLPDLRYLYKPSTVESLTVENSMSGKGENIRTKLHIDCCNILLYGLETVVGGDVDHHLEVLLKEGLLGYTMCLPAVLPVECQPRARLLVNELGKHRQLQPPSLCTLAKAHIAKTFCGLQPVMEMKSIGEFLHKYFSTS